MWGRPSEGPDAPSRVALGDVVKVGDQFVSEVFVIYPERHPQKAVFVPTGLMNGQMVVLKVLGIGYPHEMKDILKNLPQTTGQGQSGANRLGDSGSEANVPTNPDPQT